jgi:hypothetical protein
MDALAKHANDKLILPDQGSSLLKRKLSRCTLMTKLRLTVRLFIFQRLFLFHPQLKPSNSSITALGERKLSPKL